MELMITHTYIRRYTMAHNIWSSRFFNKDRKPAWHGLGINSEEDISAVQALEIVEGDYEVNLRPLVARMGATGRSSGLEIPYSIIVREPTDDDPEHRVFGSPVSSDYVLIGPREATEIFDEAVGNVHDLSHPVETLGILKQGQELFITTRTKSFDVMGEEIQSYLFFYSPMYSDKAAVVGRTDIRIVCGNTLRLALDTKGSVGSRMIISHRPGCKDEISRWLQDATIQQRESQALIEEAMRSLAGSKITEAEASVALEDIYKDPPKPKKEWLELGTGLNMTAFEKNYEDKLKKAGIIRTSILSLFQGEGAGMHSEAASGTKWGLWNAVAEYESHRRGPQERAAVALVAGDRGTKIVRAFDIIKNL